MVLMICAASCGSSGGGSVGNIFNGLLVVKSTSATALRYVGGAQSFSVTVFAGLDVATANFSLTDSGATPITTSAPVQTDDTYAVTFGLPPNQNLNGQASVYTMRVELLTADGVNVYDENIALSVVAMRLPPSPPVIP